ncbi:hypothetical protein [Xanthomonas phaseoli]|nr:hypothetical protein [Xanthomonas phaseoli]
MIGNVLLGLALAGSALHPPEGAQLDQALVSFDVLKDGELQFAQGVVAMRDKPGHVESLRGVPHIVMSCSAGILLSNRNLPNGYVLEAQLVGEQLDLRLARHIPMHFDAQVEKLKKGQCLEASPTDQVVFSSQQLLAAETNGAVVPVELGDGYTLRYRSHLQLDKDGR